MVAINFSFLYNLPSQQEVTGESEGEAALFSAKRWDRSNIADLIESAIPCHDIQVVVSNRVLSLPTPPDCSGCKVIGLHHCATTPSKARLQKSHNFRPLMQTNSCKYVINKDFFCMFGLRRII